MAAMFLFFRLTHEIVDVNALLQNQVNLRDFVCVFPCGAIDLAHCENYLLFLRVPVHDIMCNGSGLLRVWAPVPVGLHAEEVLVLF